MDTGYYHILSLRAQSQHPAALKIRDGQSKLILGDPMGFWLRSISLNFDRHVFPTFLDFAALHNYNCARRGKIEEKPMAMWLTGICLAFFAVGLVAFIASIIEEVAEIIRRGGCGQTSKVLPGMGRPRTSRRLRRPLFRSNKQNGIAPGGHLDKRHRSRAPGWAPGNLGAPLVAAHGLTGI